MWCNAALDLGRPALNGARTTLTTYNSAFRCRIGFLVPKRSEGLSASIKARF